MNICQIIHPTPKNVLVPNLLSQSGRDTNTKTRVPKSTQLDSSVQSEVCKQTIPSGLWQVGLAPTGFH